MREPRSMHPESGDLRGPGVHGAPAVAGPLLVAVQGPPDLSAAAARRLAERLRVRFARAEVEVMVVHARAEATALAPLDAPAPAADGGGLPVPVAASQGAIAGPASPLGPLLRLGVERGASALAVVAAEPHDEALDWIGLLLAPVVEDGYDFVCPAYRRRRTDGAIHTGIVAPLFRALYGHPLRQPLGTEVALSGALAQRLLDDPDWRRRPAEAGSDAWLVAKVLGSEARVAQSWLGSWPRPAAEPEEVSQVLARSLGLVFTEMERGAERWQRTLARRPVGSFGVPGFEPGGEDLLPGRLREAFALGLRELLPIWSLVLPPATLLALERCARQAPGTPGISPGLWARVIYDFAVAHMARTVERRQLLRSLAPLYLGWLAGLAHAAATLDGAAFDEHLEQVAAAFERERPYLISRWRWPDDFAP